VSGCGPVLERYLRLLGLGLLLPCLTQAGTIQDSSVSREGDSYSLLVNALIEAPPAQVYRSITDFSNLPAINPSIEESAVLASKGKRHRVHSVIKVCILVFCKRVEQVQDVTLVDSRTIVAVMVPGAGDFRTGEARWKLTADGVATELLFTETFEPDFWVPPVIGTWLIERELVREVAETALYIERMTNGQ
jgi:ribosome-associated toxin RatA of RatAB toxin-antitoxin module